MSFELTLPPKYSSSGRSFAWRPSPVAALWLALVWLLVAGSTPLRAQDDLLPRSDTMTIDSMINLSREIENEIREDGTVAGGEPATVRYDSSGVERRRPSGETMKEFRSDNDFVYDREPRDSETLWQKILRWFYTLFQKLFPDSESEVTFWTWLYRIIAAAAVVYVILKLVQTDLRSIFLPGSDGKGSGFTEVDENIHEMNLDTLIDEAVAARNYRRAVRLLYLRSLKELTDRNLIDWRRNKTNHDYLGELRNSPVRGPFADATRLFEYVWYGDVPVDESSFRNIRETFSGLSSTITRGS